ncbi:MAG: type 4a pilus biogenesis protein PilO [Candidatus Omnitrophica bacterium]|nr:type 4a pilus biogenesis protein PilO [Candidatus Omnitrophota bacterium]
MDDRRVVFLTVGVIVATLVLSIGLIQINKMRIEHLQKQVVEVKKKNEIISDILVISRQAENLKSLLPESKDPAWILDEINRVVAATEIEMKFVEPQRTEEKELYTKIPIAIGCAAPFEQIAKFISLIEGFPKYLFIDEVRITQFPEPQGKYDEALFKDRFSGSLERGAYYLKNPRAIIKVATVLPKNE